jgi:uncharacterized protein
MTIEQMLEKLQEDLKQAMKDHDDIKVSTLRMLISELKNAEISKGQALSDQDTITVLQKETKKRKEAAAGFRQGGREDSAILEQQELAIIQDYLPSQLSDEELTKIVEDTIKEVGASSMQDMGKVIGSVMGKVAGKADGGRISGMVKEKFQN